ncbi:putative nucleic acid-binding protein [Bradyrhizobium sp. CIR18]|nr:putative nucleic acid-binding protein [Bradyrhizobium sp. CIR18]
MTKWLLDTNAVIALVARRSEPLLRRVEASEPGALAISAIVAHELYFGAYRSQKVEFNLEILRLLFTDLEILDLNQEDASRRRDLDGTGAARHTHRPLRYLDRRAGDGARPAARQQQHCRISAHRRIAAGGLDEGLMLAGIGVTACKARTASTKCNVTVILRHSSSIAAALNQPTRNVRSRLGDRGMAAVEARERTEPVDVGRH